MHTYVYVHIVCIVKAGKTILFLHLFLLPIYKTLHCHIHHVEKSGRTRQAT